MPNKAMWDAAIAIVFLVTFVMVGVCIGYLLWGRQDEAVTEGHATPIQMDDGSLVASREPDAKPSVPEPKHPEGMTPVTTVEGTVAGGKPVQKPVQPGDTICKTSDDFTCPTVTVRIDLLRDPQGTYRAQITSSTGEVLDGVDIPREPIMRPIRRNWTVGLERDSDGRSGAFVAREFGRLSVGVSANQDTATARVGVKF